MPVILSKIVSKYNVAQVAMEHALSFLSLKDQAIIRGYAITGSLFAHFVRNDYLELVIWATGTQTHWRPCDGILVLGTGCGANRVFRWALANGFIDSALTKAAEYAARSADATAYAMVKARSDHIIENPLLLPVQRGHRSPYWPDMDVVIVDKPHIATLAARSGCVAILRMIGDGTLGPGLRQVVEGALRNSHRNVLEHVVERFGAERVSDAVLDTSWHAAGSVTPAMLSYMLETKLVDNKDWLALCFCKKGNVDSYALLISGRVHGIKDTHINCAIAHCSVSLVKYMREIGVVFTEQHFEEAVFTSSEPLVSLLAGLGCVPRDGRQRQRLLDLAFDADTDEDEDGDGAEDEDDDGFSTILTTRALEAIFAKADGTTEPPTKKRKLK